ncbi:MAG: zinc ribbon domain-containing protein [Ilumatobacteraceae bacterium]
MAVAAHRGLYDVDAAVPVLRGTRCGSCGAVFFPPLGIGCAACGSTELADAELAAEGDLHSFATVHLYRGKDVEAPFTVGEIVLAGGPVIRAMLTSDDIAIGDRVVAEWAVTGVDDDGAEIVEPRFRRAS